MMFDLLYTEKNINPLHLYENHNLTELVRLAKESTNKKPTLP